MDRTDGGNSANDSASMTSPFAGNLPTVGNPWVLPAEQDVGGWGSPNNSSHYYYDNDTNFVNPNIEEQAVYEGDTESKATAGETSYSSEGRFMYNEPGCSNPYDASLTCCYRMEDSCTGPFRPKAYKYNPSRPPWSWKEGKLCLACPRPIVHVPVIQEVQRRDKIVEIPQLEVIDAVQPKVYKQGVQHDVPQFDVEVRERKVDIPLVKYVDREVVVPVVTGYTHKFVPKWEIREVPRPVVKYTGEQQIIHVEVPQVKFVDKVVEREVIVDTVEKKVPKIIDEIKYVDTVKYVWKPIEKTVYVNRYVPKFDVDLECPPPLIVPYPIKSYRDAPAVFCRKSLPSSGLPIHGTTSSTTVILANADDQYEKLENLGGEPSG